MSEGEQKQERLQVHLTRVLRELQEASKGELSRRELIKKIESLSGPYNRRLLLYVANVEHPNSMLSVSDVVPLGDALASIGEADNLDVVLHTQGGDPDVAEKFVEMCRAHCRGQLRVIVPNMAKSAGTLIALGADEVLMGYCSELGPVDPQFAIVVSEVQYTVSAWTFIHARDQLQEKAQAAIAAGEDPIVYFQQLAAIDPVFVAHCEQWMTFAQQLLRKFVLNRYGQNAQVQEQADQAVAFLSNVEEHISHGRLISARELQRHCPFLNVRELPEADELWQLIWELYVRCEVFLKQSEERAKLIETAEVSLTTT